MTKVSTKLPNQLGANKQTAMLALFIVTVSVGSSFVFNRFDNAATRAINNVRSGQLPSGA